MKKTLALVLGLLLAVSGLASAQIASGNIYGQVKDASGAAVPGVNVTVVGETGTRTTVSSADGGFRVLGVPQGDYTLTLSLSGFAKTIRKLRVTTGENVEFAFTLKVSAVEETVTVTGETPLVDTKKRGTATTMTTEELNNVPSARDPWGVMKAVPGVLVDRVNIAGNENGQQASNSTKGSTSGDTTWNIDGLNVTDMSATGASASYYDFGAFQEINMTTGGTDMTMQTGGLGINLVTKRGTNAFHGSARALLANHKASFGNLGGQDQAPYAYPDLASDPRLKNADGSFRNQADHIQQISEYGFDLGGPIIKDKLWFYGTWGKQDVRLERLIGTPDRTLLPSVNAKLNWQATSKTMVSAFYFNGMKQKFGRSPGTGLLEEDGVLFNQDNAYKEGGLPGGLWKLQVDQTVTPNFYLSLKGAYYDTGFGFKTRGTGTDLTYDYVNGIAKGTGTGYLAVRPQTALNADANYFFQGLGGSNELKFGFGYRNVTTQSGSSFAGKQLVGYINSADDYVAKLFRNSDYNYHGKYLSGYVGDMLSLDRFTVNAGIRWDRQTAGNDIATAEANGAFPNLMPASTFDGTSAGDLYSWSTFSPRVGLSFALDEARKTVLRASYARYYEQLSFGSVTSVNPVNGYSYLAYGWNDSNKDGFVQTGEVDLSNFLYSYAIDPENPSKVDSSVNKIDKNVKPKHDDEFILGLDHELGGGFAVGAAVTYRVASDWRASYRVASVCAGDLVDLGSCPIIPASAYTKNAPKTVTVNGQTYSGFTYSPPVDLVTAGQSGTVATNRPNYKTHYKGLELTLNKRLSKKWMARVAFTYADWTRTYPGAQTVDGRAVPIYGNPTAVQGESFVEGDQVGIIGGGSGKANFYTSFKWQVYANALYQLPWGIDLSGAAFGRQGGLQPLYLRVPAGRDGTQNVLGTSTISDNRYGNVWDFDVRLAKTFKFGKQPYLTLAGEWFNVANSGAVLVRSRQLDASSFNRIDEVLSPSIIRLSATFGF